MSTESDMMDHESSWPAATKQLAELIHKKHEVLKRLYELSERQQKMVQSGDIVPLMRVLSVKQTLLQALQQLDRQLDPFRDEDPEERLWPSDEAREQTRQVAASCESLRQRIMAMEKESEALLTQRRAATAEQLKQLNTARQAATAYAQSPPDGLHQLDLSSDT